MDRVDIIHEFFLDFNKKPFANEELVKHFISRTSDFEDNVLKVACQELSGSDGNMPKVQQLVSVCRKYSQSMSTFQAEDCDICGGSGLVKMVEYRNLEGGKSSVYSMNFKPEKGQMFYSTVKGRCKCLNGEQYPAYPFFEPPSFIMIEAIKQGITGNYLVDNHCRELNEIS